uniref:Endonuclease/exonuclease/phosphatase domain-containing protein n=1 Tax=Heterosigma akashiwo TaxID=2829 RepID=A0A6S9ETF7_HETAK|mmetsp:Transcript_11014/g.15427  ORF Transcript_11014/g.15427 Transcript_11014/m.15427 type:complete len:632 (+) Transcript_11014:155-2050(+)
MSHNDADDPNGLHPRVQLSLRLERPIEACELQPRAYLFIKGVGAALNNRGGNQVATSGGSDNYSSTQKAAMAAAGFSLNEPHYFNYKWLRGPERQVCANPTCPRARSFSPVDWSKRARSGHRLQCVCCMKLKLPRHTSIFCTPACMQQAWPSHKYRHIIPDSPAKLPATISQEDLVEEVEKNVELEEEGVEDNEPSARERDDVKNFGINAEEDEEWVEISDGPTALYTPTAADVGHCLRLECRAFKTATDELLCPPRVITTEPVLSAPPIPPKRALVAVKGAGGGGGLRFRVVTYNILAEIYATQQMYPHIDFWALNWTYRKHNLLRELLESSADVLCLQEVQADHYENFLARALQEAGYEGLYKAKTRDSMGSFGKVDGCALLWRRSKFRLAENYAIEFNDCARRAAASLGLGPEAAAAYLHRVCKDNIAQVAVLEVLQTPAQRGGAPRRPPGPQNTHLCIANTHLYSHPEFPDVKLWQTQALMQELEHFVLSRNLPLMVVGDFNSLPSSAVYEFMAKQCVQPGHPDLVSADQHRILPSPQDLTHAIQLASAYATVQGREPPYTNHSGRFTGVLDYIWFARPHLRPLAVSPVPDLAEVEAAGEGMPNCLYSSDHALLCCDVQLGGLNTAA